MLLWGTDKTCNINFVGFVGDGDGYSGQIFLNTGGKCSEVFSDLFP